MKEHIFIFTFWLSKKTISKDLKTNLLLQSQNMDLANTTYFCNIIVTDNGQRNKQFN